MNNNMLLFSWFILLASILFLGYWRRYHSWWLPKEQIDSLKNILPFDEVLKDNVTINCRDGSLVRLIKIKGLDYSIKNKNEELQLFKRRKEWLDELAKVNAHIRLVTIRRKTKCVLCSKMPNKILQDIHDRWMQTFKNVYNNEHYVVITVPPKKFGWNKKTINHETLTNITSITQDILSEYDPVLLKHSQKDSPLLSFWSAIVNGTVFVDEKSGSNICEDVCRKAIEFNSNSGLIVYREGVKEKYLQAISLMRWGETCNNELLEALQRTNEELVLVHHLDGQSPLEAIAKLKYQAKQAAMSIGGNRKKEEYNAVITSIEEGRETLFNYQFTMFLMSDNIDKLQKIIGVVKKTLRQHGAIPILETIAIEWLWRSQFPGYNQLVYLHRMVSSQLAHWIRFTNEPRGLMKSDWGNGPIRFFQTASKGIYSLQLHESEQKEALGNSVVIAPAGSGKTTFFQHLIGGALRHDVKAYVFDRLNGMKIFTEGTGGTYINLASQNVKLNPLACEDTQENRNSIFQLLQLISGLEDDVSLEQISKAIDLIFNLPIEKRILSDLYDLIFVPNSKLKKSLFNWVGDNMFGKWFNGQNSKNEAYDSLSIEDNYLFGFEMTDIQKNHKIAACVTYYLMYKIRQSVKNSASGHLIFIDETKPMLEDPQFRKYVSELFLEHRKLRGSINVCFQDCKFLTENKISNVILEQCPTKFFFPNINAKKEHYSAFDLTDYEWDYIKGNLSVSKSLQHSVLVKKHNESIILDVDLSGLGKYLKLYKSGSEPVKLVKELQAQYGMKGWIEEYLKI